RPPAATHSFPTRRSSDLIHPRLDARRALGTVIAEHGVEGADLEPAGQKVGARPAGKAADVRRAIGEARKAEVDDLLDRQLEMIRSEEHTSELQSLAYLVC